MMLTSADAQNFSNYIFRDALERLQKITCGQTSISLKLINLVVPGSSKGTTYREREELVSTFKKVSALTAAELQGLMATTSMALSFLNRLERTHRVLHKILVEEPRVVNPNEDDFVRVVFLFEESC